MQVIEEELSPENDTLRGNCGYELLSKQVSKSLNKPIAGRIFICAVILMSKI